MVKEINPLIVVPSPRNIGVVKECLDLLPYDKLWMKENFDEVEAYTILRNYFLEHKEYTHFVIIPDDLMVPVSAFNKLLADVKKKDYAVISGICNFNCETLGTTDKPGSYDRMLAVDANHQNGTKYLLEHEIPHPNHYVKSGQLSGIKRVSFSGFAVAFIRRDVIEKISFDTKGRGLDSAFSHKLLLNKIDQYIDFDAESLHLKGIENCENIGALIQFQFDNNITSKVNTKKRVIPRLLFQPVNGETQELDYTKYK